MSWNSKSSGGNPVGSTFGTGSGGFDNAWGSYVGSTSSSGSSNNNYNNFSSSSSNNNNCSRNSSSSSTRSSHAGSFYGSGSSGFNNAWDSCVSKW